METKTNLVAVAIDKSFYYQIIDLINEDVYTKLENTIALKVHPLALIKLQKYLANLDFKYSIIVLKPIEDEIKLYDVNIIENKRLNQENNELDEMKNFYNIKFIQLFDKHIATISHLTYYEFTCLNNILADKGFFITDENREEKYIEILESEDEELINILEKYLLCKDEIERVYAGYNNYKNFKLELEECENIEEVEEKAKYFLEDWNYKSNYIKLEG